jgi:hypothetical protein
MIRFPIVANLKNPPRCPICQRDLHPCGFWVYNGLAYCLECAHYATAEALALERDSAAVDTPDNQFARVHGVLFYVPPPALERGPTAAQIRSQLGDLPPIFPTEQLVHAGKRTKPLGQLNLPKYDPPAAGARGLRDTPLRA